MAEVIYDSPRRAMCDLTNTEVLVVGYEVVDVDGDSALMYILDTPHMGDVHGRWRNDFELEFIPQPNG